ncbi:MAG: sulfurtransferase [Ilumatobacter sp.]|uniref:sulfurtransferase n=1 Tax=Ilumatobacter sp. TaxID=1967498 RepID=UPI002609EAFA|nr:sulfurtransferase [Ilumatobacter sp.]MDJ0767940.1 sulfurtransferase [Ilumatobacter sp.]
MTDSTHPPGGDMDTLVSTDWLSDHLHDDDLVVLDCSVYMDPDGDGGMRTVPGRARYEDGHIPGAGFADLCADLADPDSAWQFAMPTPERFCAAMGALGVGDDSRVVLYDGTIAAWAARVWWMLRWVGFDRAALLDGGLQAWTAEGRPLSTEAPAHPQRSLVANVRPELIADRDEVLAAIDDGATCLIDTLMPEHYRGEMQMYERPGHIPGASNVAVTSLLAEGYRFRPLDELAALHPENRDARTITYCGGGIAASANAFAMHRLGFSDLAVYTASLQEWAADPDLPMTTEEAR